MKTLALSEETVHASNTLKDNSNIRNIGRYNQSATGTVNLAGGHDWSGANTQTFQIKYDGADAKTVTLDANCANLAAVKAEIEQGVDAQFTNNEFTIGDDGSNHITLVCGTNHYFELIEVTALVTIGWTAKIYGDKYWWAERSDNILVIKTCPVIDFNQAAQTERTYVDATYPYASDPSFILRIFGDNIFGVFSFKSTVDRWLTLISYSLDGGISWTNRRGGPVADAASSHYSYDIFNIGSDYFVIYSVLDGGNNVVWMFNPVTPSGATTGLVLNDTQAVYPGLVIGSYYYFMIKTGGALKIYKIDSSRVATLVSTPSITEPAVYNHDQQQYWIVSSVEYTVDQDHMYMRVAEIEWVSYSASGSTTTGIIWSYDSNGNYIINDIIWSDRIHKIFPSGGLGAILFLVTSARVGMDDWFVDITNTKIYSIVISTYAVDFCTINKKQYYAPSCTVVDITEPTENKFLILYDNNDNIIFQGWIDAYEWDGANFTYDMRSPIEQDLSIRINETFTTKTLHYILKYILDNYCAYLYYDTNISTTPATLYTITFHNKSVIDVMKWIDSQVGYQTSFRPSFEVYWDQCTSSVQSINDATDNFEGVPVYKKSPVKISSITLYGAYVNGNRLSSVKYGEPNLVDMTDWYPEIDVQATLDALATAIMNNKNKSIITLQFKVNGKGQLHDGTTIAITFTEFGYAADTFYIIGNSYDAKHDISDVVMTDALYILPVKDEGRNSTNLEEYIDQVNVRVDDTETSVSDLDTELSGDISDLTTVVNALISDTAFTSAFDAITDKGLSKNVFYDVINAILQSCALTSSKLIGWNGFVDANNYGACVSVDNSDVDAFCNSALMVPFSGNYKIGVIHANSAIGRNNSGKFYCRDGTTASWNKINGENMDWADNATALVKNYTLSSAIALVAGRNIDVYYVKDAGTTGGSFQYIYGFYLVWQGT